MNPIIRNRPTTIYKQLIINIVVPVVIALMLLALINYIRSKSTLEEHFENTNFIISDEITHIHEFQDLALEILEESLDKKLKRHSDILVNEYFKNTSNIESVDLDRIRDEIGMDPEMEDIYIINKQGTIVNTTFEKDKNLNLFNFGEEHKNYLLNVFEGGEFVSERIAIENKTKRLRKYSYHPTHDKKYIVELGIYSEKADEIIDFIRNRINELPEKQESIVNVDIFIGEEHPFSLLNSAEIPETNRELVEKVFRNKDRTSVIRKEDGKKIHYEYIYMTRANTSLYKGSVIQIISDRTGELRLMRNELLKFLIIFGLTILSVIILIYKNTRVITDPIKKLVNNVNRITNGHLNERAEVVGNNEITKLSEQFNRMIEQLESYYYELEEKVRERTSEIYQQKEEIEAQRDALEDQRNMLAEKNNKLENAYHEIEQQKKNITDSIQYAKRIQTAILPQKRHVDELLPHSFILFKPRDIVSGDFYWTEKVNGRVLIAAADCTGHGVPGAFMSILNYNQLNFAAKIKKMVHPAEILDDVNYGITHTLQQRSGLRSVRDGMDVALCSIDFENKNLEFAGAYNPLIVIRDNEIIQIKGDKHPIGSFIDQKLKSFTNHEISIQQGDIIYIFSDGYVDQFGGPNGRKFMIKKFKELLMDIHKEPLHEQKEILDRGFNDWRGKYIQIDDILVIGIKVV